MRLNFCTVVAVVLASAVVHVSANTTIKHRCCDLHSNEHTDNRIKNIYANGIGDDKDDNDNSSDNNISNSSSTNERKLIICKDQCEAQWKSDFHIHFQKSYDEEFYEFPLDEKITASFDNFYTFCNITKEKLACWSMQCQMNLKDITWSSDLHICAFRRMQFENALSCLNRTSTGAHNECNKMCRKFARRYRTKGSEKTYLYDVSASLAEIYQYWQLNKQCVFQICQLECRKKLIKNMCDDNERIGGTEVIEDYYKYDLLDQLRSLINSSIQHLYPLMCRSYLPVQYHLKLANETSDEIKQSIQAVKYATNEIVELLTRS